MPPELPACTEEWTQHLLCALDGAGSTFSVPALLGTEYTLQQFCADTARRVRAALDPQWHAKWDRNANIHDFILYELLHVAGRMQTGALCRKEIPGKIRAALRSQIRAGFQEVGVRDSLHDVAEVHKVKEKGRTLEKRGIQMTRENEDFGDWLRLSGLEHVLRAIPAFERFFPSAIVEYERPLRETCAARIRTFSEWAKRQPGKSNPEVTARETCLRGELAEDRHPMAHSAGTNRVIRTLRSLSWQPKRA